MLNKKEYIHYGHNVFDAAKLDSLNPVKSNRSKPQGLWASPVDADYGWKDWCESEGYFQNDFALSFKFVLNNGANILEIHKEDDILPYLESCTDLNSLRLSLTSICDKLNLTKIYSEFDGMELFLSDDYSMHYGIFNSWDCDSIVIWNSGVIEPI